MKKIKSKPLVRNWKTTVGGILTIAAPIIESFLSDKINWQMAVPQLITGVALLCAKDFNVTGDPPKTITPE
ncbi:hypothetical protein SAMN05192574_101388 [Mucilaginibacter gossypiicola]|uniref:Uncharacterized protein n=1 Tax=Mucilaginibacter gossypiicola TaxID=551995 RepID=A0A1H8A6M2_9SPHI|nr:hypothetical protein [Mucilaginibacter gossypiicola]SEM66415.1 hypothetical protein SAMN05192574_101388 [Mucilaginibacter gossypiicola]